MATFNAYGYIRLYPTPPPVTAPMPTLFPDPGDTTPQLLFPPGLTSTDGHFKGQNARFVCRYDRQKILIYTDGSCLNNGKDSPRGGSAFVFRESGMGPGGLVNGCVSLRLENEGPGGEIHTATNNRAELRAVLAALQFRYWTGENVRTLVLVTDSEYVANGCTRWVHKWESNGWRTGNGRPVKNRDMWEALLAQFRLRSSQGLHVQFWRIPRELNTEADRAAREGAAKSEVQTFETIRGVLV